MMNFNRWRVQTQTYDKVHDVIIYEGDWPREERKKTDQIVASPSDQQESPNFSNEAILEDLLSTTNYTS